MAGAKASGFFANVGGFPSKGRCAATADQESCSGSRGNRQDLTRLGDREAGSIPRAPKIQREGRGLSARNEQGGSDRCPGTHFPELPRSQTLGKLVLQSACCKRKDVGAGRAAQEDAQ